MPGTTPNRGYPYPVTGDPFDVPGDIQRLAEAIDLDMEDLDNRLIQRPMALVSWQGTSQLFPADQVTEAEFNFVHVDTAGISNLSQEPTRLTPTSSGLWAVWGAIRTPVAQSDVRDLFLRVNGGDLTRQNFHVNEATQSQYMMTICAMAFMDGVGDYFTMTFNPTGGLDDYRISVKRMACFQLTEA